MYSSPLIHFRDPDSLLSATADRPRFARCARLSIPILTTHIIKRRHEPPFYYIVPEVGIEPTRREAADFKSTTYTSSVTRA